MTQTVAITASYSDEITECKGVLFELPAQEAQAGDQVEMRLWGGTRELLEPYTLYKGTQTMGAGELLETDIITITPVIDFAETFKHQLEWPIDSIEHVEAITEMFVIDDNEVETWASRGDNITDRFFRDGYSCITAADRIPLYGSVRATCNRSPHLKRWYWTVPAGAEGLHWFFIYKKNMVLDHKFSVELPDLADSELVYRNIIMRIVDKDTDTGQFGAVVFIDGLEVGTTDADGELAVENIRTGDHSLFVTCSGYLDTDQDNLNNDSFTVF